MNKERIKEILTPLIKAQMEEELESTVNPIFVFTGMNDYVNMNEFDNYIIDKDSFQKNDNSQFFNQTWFAEVCTKLNNAMANPDIPYTVLSFPQFSYLISYIQPEFFKNRLIIVRDGFRSLLPLDKSEFIEKVGQ